ncbi:MAG: DUF2914 domain-containing protein [Myxococcales bacterium]|nr:DUF2914 domain-containing protein [Myxococcales bacterium]
MKTVALVSAGVLALSMMAGVSTAEAALTWRRGQFTDRVERGQPVGDAAAALRGPNATYWMEIGNDGAPENVTLVWRVDGREVRRQSLEIGRAPRWRTWGFARVRGGRAVEVTVLDASGATLHTEQLPSQ